MKFSPQFLDSIRNRIQASSLIGRSVAWDRRKTRASKGDYWGCCPFHGEKTASFHVVDRKGTFYCFGCQAKGDTFSWLVQHDGLTFPEAVERLANEAGIPMPEFTPEERRKAKVRATLYDVMDMAAKFYQATLSGSAAASNARDYLVSRALSSALIKEFGIGYAPNDKQALRKHLAGKGVSIEQMIEAGLLVSGEDIPDPYDRFRDRVMFPILDSRGRTIAFGGRALAKNAMAKYLNSPETPVFRKGGALYNYERGRTAAHKTAELIVVEGYMDTIAVHSAGIQQVVAPLGTALTVDQLSLLWRLVPEPTLCFDGDAAGIKAAWRAMEMAMPVLSPGHTLKFCFLPNGVDPDDMLRKHGPKELRAALSSTKSLLDVAWDRASQLNDRSSPERAAQFEKDLIVLAGSIQDETVRNYYRRAIVDRLKSVMANYQTRRLSVVQSTNPLWQKGQSASTLLSALSAFEARTQSFRSILDQGCSDIE